MRLWLILYNSIYVLVWLCHNIWESFSISNSHYDDVIMSAIASQITSLTIVYSIVYSDEDQRKHQSSASLAFVRGIHRGPVNSPYKWPVTRKMFPFDDVIMLVSTVTVNALVPNGTGTTLIKLFWQIWLALVPQELKINRRDIQRRLNCTPDDDIKLCIHVVPCCVFTTVDHKKMSTEIDLILSNTENREFLLYQLCHHWRHPVLS